MKKLIVLVLLAIPAVWWQFVGWRQELTEDHVREYYAMAERATLQRDPAANCALLDAKFKTEGFVTMAGKRTPASNNKKQACDGYVELFGAWEKIGEKMGGIVQLDSQYTIHNINLSADRKTATVDFSSTLDVAGSLMHIKGRSTDTLVRKSGKVLMVRSEGEGTVSGRLMGGDGS
jgi:hypothetical protein